MIAVSANAFGGAVLLALLALLAWLFGRILAKAGFSGWWGLVGLVPGINLVAIWLFAFVDWPRGGAPAGGGWTAPAAASEISRRLDALDRLRAEGRVSDDEYAARRQMILDDL